MAFHEPCTKVFFLQNFLLVMINEIPQLPITPGSAVKSPPILQTGLEMLVRMMSHVDTFAK